VFNENNKDDYRTNIQHTPKKRTMTMQHLEEFITLYNSENLDKRKETWSEENEEGRWRKYAYEDIIARDKTSLDIFWIKDKSLTDLDNPLLPTRYESIWFFVLRKSDAYVSFEENQKKGAKRPWFSL
jgi:hypothetical protein